MLENKKEAGRYGARPVVESSLLDPQALGKRTYWEPYGIFKIPKLTSNDIPPPTKLCLLILPM